MSLVEMNLSKVVKHQFSFKVKAYVGVFASLMAMQTLAIFFSFLGASSSYFGGSTVSVSYTYYSADIVVGATMLWGFISAILITTKANRYDDFTFVTNRLSSNLSNMIFLIVASIIGGITSVLSGYLIKVLAYLFKDIQLAASVSLQELLIGFGAAVLYVLLFSSLGYLVGVLIQLHQSFIIVLPTLFILGTIAPPEKLLFSIHQFILIEPSIIMFLTKVVIIAGLLFVSATALSNRLGVRN